MPEGGERFWKTTVDTYLIDGNQKLGLDGGRASPPGTAGETDFDKRAPERRVTYSLVARPVGRSRRLSSIVGGQKKAAPLLGPQFKRGKRKEVRKGDARGQSGGRIGIE
jgi:hypothetical protein